MYIIFTYIYAYTHIHTYTYVHSPWVCVCMHVHNIHKRIRMCTYTRIRTYKHIHIYIHIHTCTARGFSGMCRRRGVRWFVTRRQSEKLFPWRTISFDTTGFYVCAYVYKYMCLCFCVGALCTWYACVYTELVWRTISFDKIGVYVSMCLYISICIRMHMYSIGICIAYTISIFVPAICIFVPAISLQDYLSFDTTAFQVCT